MKLQIEPEEILYYIGPYDEHNLVFYEKNLGVVVRLTDEQLIKLKDDLIKVYEKIIEGKR